MLREYVVTIERSDRDKPDPIEIFAKDRDDAIKAVKSIYRTRFRALIGARLKKPTKSEIAREIADKLGWPVHEMKPPQDLSGVGFLRRETSSAIELEATP